MKKYVLGILFCSCLLGTGIGCSEKAREEKILETGKSGQNEITIMHVDADYPEFQKFIDQAEKDLDLKIHIVSYPENADNRQAEVSTILSAGEDSVDIFSANDEMVSEFKYKGYLEPLNDTVMTEYILSCYPESYMQNIAMLDGKVYSVPYSMDIMVFWVNKSMIAIWRSGLRKISSAFWRRTSERGAMDTEAHGTALMYIMNFPNLSIFLAAVIMTGTARLPGKLLPFWRIW